MGIVKVKIGKNVIDLQLINNIKVENGSKGLRVYRMLNKISDPMILSTSLNSNNTFREGVVRSV